VYTAAKKALEELIEQQQYAEKEQDYNTFLLDELNTAPLLSSAVSATATVEKPAAPCSSRTAVPASSNFVRVCFRRSAWVATTSV